jgi:hypothetical protein
LEEVEQLLQSSAAGALPAEMAKTSSRSRPSVAELADAASRQCDAIEMLLARSHNGEKVPTDHITLVRDLIDNGQVPTRALWREMEILV